MPYALLTQISTKPPKDQAEKPRKLLGNTLKITLGRSNVHM